MVEIIVQCIFKIKSLSYAFYSKKKLLFNGLGAKIF